MSKQILSGFDAIKKLELGVSKLANAVKVTQLIKLTDDIMREQGLLQ